MMTYWCAVLLKLPMQISCGWVLDAVLGSLERDAMLVPSLRDEEEIDTFNDFKKHHQK